MNQAHEIRNLNPFVALFVCFGARCALRIDTGLKLIGTADKYPKTSVRIGWTEDLLISCLKCFFIGIPENFLTLVTYALTSP